MTLANPRDVTTGIDLDGLPAGRLSEIAQRVGVCARTSPVHKLRLVEALQACPRSWSSRWSSSRRPGAAGHQGAALQDASPKLRDGTMA